MVWLPLKCWKGDPEKIERLTIEGQYIWLWNPELNVTGKGGDPTDPLNAFGRALVLGRRNRTRQLLKFRRRSAEKTFFITSEKEKIHAKDSAAVKEGQLSAERRIRLYTVLMRMQRRPWVKQHNFDQQRTVVAVRGYTITELYTLLTLACQALDSAGRSIFFRNFRLIMKDEDRV